MRLANLLLLVLFGNSGLAWACDFNAVDMCKKSRTGGCEARYLTSEKCRDEYRRNVAQRQAQGQGQTAQMPVEEQKRRYRLFADNIQKVENKSNLSEHDIEAIQYWRRQRKDIGCN